MPQGKKQRRKLTRLQLRQLSGHTHDLAITTEVIKAESAKRADRVKLLFDHAGSWGRLYEWDQVKLLAAFLVITGSTNDVVAAAQSEDPNGELLSKIEDEWEPEGLTEHEQALACAVTLAVIGNFNALRIFSLTITEMVSQAADGSDDALFKAVTVDRSVVQAEPIARSICRAQLSGDESFMQKLAKAITRTVPRRPRKKFDDLRYILAVLDETVGLKNLTHAEIAKIVIDDLPLYSDSTDAEDPIAGIRKIVQKLRN